MVIIFLTMVATGVLAYAGLVGIPDSVDSIETAVENIPERWEQMEREFQEFHFAARRLCAALEKEPESDECRAALIFLAENPPSLRN